MKELAIWQLYTDLDKKKQGPALTLSLTGKARDCVLELPVDDIGTEGSVKKIIDRRDKLFLKDKVQNAYIAYETFESFKRSSEMSVTEYNNESERLHHKLKEYDMGLPSGVLAYKLLKQAGLSESHEQLARAMAGELTFENMKL